jgi:hypothetical protein
MSFLGVTPDAVTSAAGHLGTIGSALNEADAAAGPTTGVAAMAADEVSAAVQSIFAGHAQAYQSLSAQLSAYHSKFVSLLNGGAAQYLSAEIANAQQTLGGGAPASAVPAVTVTNPPPTGPTTTTVSLLNAGPVKITESISSNNAASITFKLGKLSFTDPLSLQAADFLLHSGL